MLNLKVKFPPLTIEVSAEVSSVVSALIVPPSAPAAHVPLVSETKEKTEPS